MKTPKQASVLQATAARFHSYFKDQVSAIPMFRVKLPRTSFSATVTFTDHFEQSDVVDHFGPARNFTRCQVNIVAIDGGWTVCTFEGFSVCSPADAYDFIAGRQLSLTRALASKGSFKMFFDGKNVKMTRTRRALIWATFFKTLSLPYTVVKDAGK